MNRLNEAFDVKTIYNLFEKANSAIRKAQTAVLDVADVMVELLEASSTPDLEGSKIKEILPGHIKKHIADLTNVADKSLGEISEGEGQSSMKKLKELVDNIPIGSLRPQSTETKRQQISTQPNLTGGPQSQISTPQVQESLEDFYRYINENSYDDKNFDFRKLTESNIYGQRLEEDMMAQLKMKQAAPLQTAQIREKVRAAVNDDFFEDQEQLQESGPLDFSKLRAFGGADGMPMKFDTLSTGGHVIADGVK